MIIDAHVYCIPPQLQTYDAKLMTGEEVILDAIYRHQESPLALALSDIGKIRESMKQNSIDKVLLVPLPWYSEELCRISSEYLIDLAAKDEDLYALCTVSPTLLDKGLLEKHLKAGAVGIKVNPAWQKCVLDSAEMDALSELAGHYGVPIMVHIDHSYKRSVTDPASLLNLASRHPYTKYLAAHLGGGLGLYSLHPPLREKMQNIWFDTATSSTMMMVKFYVEAGLQDRLLFGTDFPFNHCHNQYDQICSIQQAGFGENVTGNIFSNNFNLLFGV